MGSGFDAVGLWWHLIGSGGWGGHSKVGSGLCGGVGTIEMQEPTHLQQSSVSERHKERKYQGNKFCILICVCLLHVWTFDLFSFVILSCFVSYPVLFGNVCLFLNVCVTVGKCWPGMQRVIICFD